KTITKSTTAKSASKPEIQLAFGKINYILMISGIVLILFGYMLMSGGGSDDPKVFNPAIFDTQRLTVAPIMVVLGYALEVLAIVVNAKD
ncbi:MAG: DUF3098 domain-containing protein, partial [Bacteroidota bacterium]